MKKGLYRFFLLIILVFLTTIPLNEIFKRKSIVEPFNNLSRISGLYNLPQDSIDLVIVGSSHAYTSINPILLYEQYGIKSFVMSSQQQSIAMSYFHIKEVFQRQNPKIVVLNTYMFNKTKEFNDSITSDAVEYLQNSPNKFKMIKELVPIEKRPSYYFPLIKYHNRWNELSSIDFKYAFKVPESNTLGFVPLESIKKVKKSEGYKVQIENYIEVLDSQDIEYFTKILDLCKMNETELILYNAPYNIDDNSNYISSALELYLEEIGIQFYDFSRNHDLFSLDYDTDYFDASHLNKFGASKFTKKFGELLLEDQKMRNTFNLDYDSFFSEKTKKYFEQHH